VHLPVINTRLHFTAQSSNQPISQPASQQLLRVAVHTCLQCNASSLLMNRTMVDTMAPRWATTMINTLGQNCQHVLPARRFCMYVQSVMCRRRSAKVQPSRTPRSPSFPEVHRSRAVPVPKPFGLPATFAVGISHATYHSHQSMYCYTCYFHNIHRLDTVTIAQPTVNYSPSRNLNVVQQLCIIGICASQACCCSSSSWWWWWDAMTSIDHTFIGVGVAR
jgi:hypothetical protein